MSQEMEIKTPNYFGIIPANVRYDKDLSPNAKIFYSELTCLSTKEGYCFASNNYFAELYNVVPSSISNWVKQLSDKGYVKVEYIYDGNECKERRIYISDNGIQKNEQVFKKNDEGIQKFDEGYSKKTKDNNTSINNININNNKVRKTKSKAELFDRVDEYTTNQDLRDILKKYLQFKLSSSRSFNLDQWNIQLNNLRKFSKGNVITEISKVTKSYANGYQSLVYDNELVNSSHKGGAYDIACNHIDPNHDYSKDAGQIMADGTLGF